MGRDESEPDDCNKPDRLRAALDGALKRHYAAHPDDSRDAAALLRDRAGPFAPWPGDDDEPLDLDEIDDSDDPDPDDAPPVVNPTTGYPYFWTPPTHTASLRWYDVDNGD